MAKQPEVKELLDAGVHFGHLTRKWNPNMAPYIYMERNGIHIVNLYKTAAKLEEATDALRKIASSGRKILFIATKKQAKDIVAEKAKAANMPYITERWPGGMLTNFVTIRRAVRKMTSIDKMKQDGTFETLSKKERLAVNRLRAKLEKNLGSISDMTRLPAAIFVVDITHEHIAVAEALKLNIPIFAMVDTNSDPREIDYVIPSNDDASKSIECIVRYVSEAIIDGLSERKAGKKDDERDQDDAKEKTKEVKTKKAKAKTEEAKSEEAKTEEAKPEETEEVKTEEAKSEKTEEAKPEKAETEEKKPEKKKEASSTKTEEEE